MKKIIFDLIFSFLLLLIFSWLIIFLWIISTIVFKRNGFFLQERIGKNGRSFFIIKIRSLYITNHNDLKSNWFGIFIRKYKLDEIPQLINVLLGQMSLVGPRPELKDYFIGKDYPKNLLSLRPGITGLASLYFVNEADIQNKSIDVLAFSKWMYLRKKTLNLIYLKNQGVCFDLNIMYLTIYMIFFNTKNNFER